MVVDERGGAVPGEDVEMQNLVVDNNGPVPDHSEKTGNWLISSTRL